MRVTLVNKRKQIKRARKGAYRSAHKGEKKRGVKLASRVKEGKPKVEGTSFSKLCDSVGQISRLMASTSSELEKLQLDIEDYGAESWEKQKELRNKYYRMTSSLFLLLDHIENIARDADSSEIDWIHGKIRRILEDEGIEEIPAKKGDSFSGLRHKHVDGRPDELPKGTVLEVVRKGYFVRGRTSADDVTLRPVETIVSSGPPKKGSNSEISKEEDK